LCLGTEGTVGVHRDRRDSVCVKGQCLCLGTVGVHRDRRDSVCVAADMSEQCYVSAYVTLLYV
jgi:hypothetical protein